MSENWLTPETAIGCRLPCGATVITENGWRDNKAAVSVDFDRKPVSCGGAKLDSDGWWFYTSGRQISGIFPNLIPPTPAQPGVFVTREAWQKAIKNLDADWTFRELELALGIPPDPPKVAPWEAAYVKEWAESPSDEVRRGVSLIWSMVDAECGTWVNPPAVNGYRALRAKIMGDQA